MHTTRNQPSMCTSLWELPLLSDIAMSTMDHFMVHTAHSKRCYRRRKQENLNTTVLCFYKIFLHMYVLQKVVLRSTCFYFPLVNFSGVQNQSDEAVWLSKYCERFCMHKYTGPVKLILSKAVLWESKANELKCPKCIMPHVWNVLIFLLRYTWK